jgi:multidrug efflux system outer membrane protein
MYKVSRADSNRVAHAPSRAGSDALAASSHRTLQPHPQSSPLAGEGAGHHPRGRVRYPVLLAALAFAGCTMIPHYLRPEAPVAGQFPGGGKKSSGAADTSWRDFFADPRLKRYIEIALANNRDLRVAVLNVAQARAQYRISRADLFPHIDGTGIYERSRSASETSSAAATGGSTTGASTSGSSVVTAAAPGQTAPITTNLYSVSVGTTSWELDLFGRVRSLNRQALEKYFAQDETRRSTQLSLVAQVATQYLTLREQEEQLAVARQTLMAVQKSYDLNKKQFDVGTTSELDLKTSEAQVQTARVNVFTYERTTAQAANYLALLIGAPLPTDAPAGRSLQAQRVIANIPAGLPSDLLARRPDILSAEHTLLAANANIGAARAAFFPVISLTTSAGYTSLELSKLFNKPSEVWSFAPQITLPIFAGGSNLANLDVAKISKRIEIANYEKAIQTAFREVSDALAGRPAYDHALVAQEALAEAQQRRYELTESRYRSGVDNYLAVLLAQQDLYAAQRDLVTARADRLANLITLYKSIGGGWR